ncbi:MAG: hypothetical protein IPP71_12365 [Bacteroidetes bacterium]|nr:hypothetical protein [Bacteroidota bacterium]
MIFVKNVTGPWSDICTEMVLDEIGNIYLTGGFQNTANFNPPSTFNLTSYGDYDVLFMKFSACVNTSSSLNISSCNYYLSPSGNYTWTSSGIYADTIYNSSLTTWLSI